MQHELVAVGARLTCQDGESKVMDRALENFEQAHLRRSKIVNFRSGETNIAYIKNAGNIPAFFCNLKKITTY